MIAKVTTGCRAEPDYLLAAKCMVRRSADARICRIAGVTSSYIYAMASVAANTEVVTEFKAEVSCLIQTEARGANVRHPGRCLTKMRHRLLDLVRQYR